MRWLVPSQNTDSMLPEQVRLLYGGAREAFFATLLNACLLAYMQRTVLPLSVLAAWLGYIVVVTIARSILVLRYRRASNRDSEARLWMKRYGVGAAAAGAGWGAAGFVLFPPESFVHQMFVVFVQAGMAAGAVALLTPRFGVFLSFFVPLMLPTTINLFAQGGEVHIVMGLMVVLYALALLITAGRTHAMIVSSIQLSSHNADLVRSLSAQKETAEQLNMELRQQIEHRERMEAALGESREQLAQAQKMEAVGQLAGGIAHDFNNLLQIIKGYSQVILKEAGLPVTQRNNLEQIHEASDRAHALTEKLLAFSRRQIVDARPLEINAAVGNLMPMLNRLIGEDIRLTTILAPEAGWVNADPVHIEQVLLNLVLNAKDAMPEGGTVTIETASLEFDPPAAQRHPGVQVGRFTRLQVTDTGHGMDSETQRRIFEPFYTTKEVGKGTGLGLSIVYYIVTQCAGFIDVASAPGRGTTFSVHLPRLDGVRDQPKPARDDGEIRGGREIILVVEDEKTVRSLITVLLRKYGYTVLEAGDGEEALRILAESPAAVDLVVTDVIMPRMGGAEMAQRARARHADLRFLYITGYPNVGVLRGGTGEVLTPYIKKPFPPELLARTVRDLLDK